MAELKVSCSEDTSYVNVHGNDVKVLVCSKTGKILIPIEELKETGFNIYPKNQYNKLLVDDNDYTDEFNLYMLQCAKTYMLKNMVVFKENEILESINKCKKLLNESNKKTVSSSPFMQNRVIREHDVDDFTIVTNCYKQSTPITVQNVNSFNNRKVTSSNSRRSSTSSSDNSRRSVDGRMSRNSFEPCRLQKSENHNQTTSIQRNKNDLKNEQNVNSEARKLLNSIALENPEHQIIVTSVEEKSPTTIWAQDVNNADTLIEIDNKIKEELKNERVVTRCEFNNIYLSKDEDAWFRCKPIKFRPLTVAFIDYGNTAQINDSDLRLISKELADIPAQAVKMILENHPKPSLYDTLSVKIISKKERGTYVAKVVNEETKEPEKKCVPQSPMYFNKIPMQCDLQNGQKIMIIGETRGKLAVRTKESYEKLKKIEEAMKKSADFLPLPEKPAKKQVVVVYNGDSWKRGEVVDIDGAKVLVILLDYYKQIKVDLSQLKNIPESLYREAMTYLLTQPLKSYEVGNQKALDYIQRLVETQAKPTVVLDGDEFDLMMENTLLSERLASLKDRVMLKELEMYKPPTGQGTYMLYACRNSDNVTLVSPEEVEKYVDAVIKTDLDDEDSYVPILNEVCLGLYQGSWSRCVVLKVLSSRFEVRFIDFGNVEFLNSDQLKKLTSDAKKPPILGVLCRFVGLPQVNDADELITKFVEDGECYDLVIKRFDGTCYEINVPSIYEKIKETH